MPPGIGAAGGQAGAPSKVSNSWQIDLWAE